MTEQDIKKMLEEQMELLSERMKKEEDSRLFADLTSRLLESIYAWIRLFNNNGRLL